MRAKIADRHEEKYPDIQLLYSAEEEKNIFCKNMKICQ